MTNKRGTRAESKNCEILLLPTADRRFDTKSQMLHRAGLILGQIPHCTELLFRIEKMERADWLICLSASKFDPRSTFRNNFLQLATNVFVPRQVDHAR